MPTLTTTSPVDPTGLAGALGIPITVRDDGTSREVEWTGPTTEAQVLAAIATNPQDPLRLNREVIEAALDAAIADNADHLADVQGATTLIGNVQTAADNLQAATIGNVAAAQVAIRGIGDQLERICTLFTGMLDAHVTELTELQKLARLLRGDFTDTD